MSWDEFWEKGFYREGLRVLLRFGGGKPEWHVIGQLSYTTLGGCGCCGISMSKAVLLKIQVPTQWKEISLV